MKFCSSYSHSDVMREGPKACPMHLLLYIIPITVACGKQQDWYIMILFSVKYKIFDLNCYILCGCLQDAEVIYGYYYINTIDGNLLVFTTSSYQHNNCFSFQILIVDCSMLYSSLVAHAHYIVTHALNQYITSCPVDSQKLETWMATCTLLH